MQGTVGKNETSGPVKLGSCTLQNDGIRAEKDSINANRACNLILIVEDYDSWSLVLLRSNLLLGLYGLNLFTFRLLRFPSILFGMPFYL